MLTYNDFPEISRLTAELILFFPFHVNYVIDGVLFLCLENER